MTYIVPDGTDGSVLVLHVIVVTQRYTECAVRCEQWWLALSAAEVRSVVIVIVIVIAQVRSESKKDVAAGLTVRRSSTVCVS